MGEVQACSISRSTWEELGKAGQAREVGSVSAVFERACLLVFPGRPLLAVVLPGIGDGPLNIVLAGGTGAFPAIGTPVEAHQGTEWLRMGGLQVCLKGATIWEPRPDWQRLRAHAAAVQEQLPHLATLALKLAPRDSLLSLLRQALTGREDGERLGVAESRHAWDHALASAASEALPLLSQGWSGDRAQLQTAASHLAGLGSGLTPSGDDLLIGVMIWTWLAHPTPEEICGPLADGAHLRTTALSTALLSAAARGECSAPWHRLLEELRCGPDGEVVAAIRTLLEYGHTSGADALAGFIWIGLHAWAKRQGAQ